MTMTTKQSPQVVIMWLQEAGGYAYELEDPTRYQNLRPLIDVLVGSSTVGVRVTYDSKLKYECVTWSELERAETNPLLKLIDEVLAQAVSDPRK
jgi:hypothetical protein